MSVSCLRNGRDYCCKSELTSRMIYSSDCSGFSINCVGIAVGIFVGLNDVDYLRSCLSWDSVVLRMEFELWNSRTVLFQGVWRLSNI